VVTRTAIRNRIAVLWALEPRFGSEWRLAGSRELWLSECGQVETGLSWLVRPHHMINKMSDFTIALGSPTGAAAPESCRKCRSSADQTRRTYVVNALVSRKDCTPFVWTKPADVIITKATSKQRMTFIKKGTSITRY
jgi:hypothetical protein